jgi:hypothetical protein
MSEPIAIPGLEQTSTASPLVASKADCTEDPVIQNKSSTDVPTESFTQSEKESITTTTTTTTTGSISTKRKHSDDGIGCSVDTEDNSETYNDDDSLAQHEAMGSKMQAMTHHRYGPIAVSLIGSIIVF